MAIQSWALAVLRKMTFKKKKAFLAPSDFFQIVFSSLLKKMHSKWNIIQLRKILMATYIQAWDEHESDKVMFGECH